MHIYIHISQECNHEKQEIRPAPSNQPFCLNIVFKDNSICSISLQLSISNDASTALHLTSGDEKSFHSLGLHAEHLKVGLFYYRHSNKAWAC